MNRHSWLSCCVLGTLVALLGCQNSGQYDLMERELRLQEDRIYELESYIEQYQTMLEAAEQSSGDSTAEGAKEPERRPIFDRRSTDAGQEDAPFEPPQIELGNPGFEQETPGELPEGKTDLDSLPELPRELRPFDPSAESGETLPDQARGDSPLTVLPAAATEPAKRWRKNTASSVEKAASASVQAPVKQAESVDHKRLERQPRQQKPGKPTRPIWRPFR